MERLFVFVALLIMFKTEFVWLFGLGGHLCKMPAFFFAPHQDFLCLSASVPYQIAAPLLLQIFLVSSLEIKISRACDRKNLEILLSSRRENRKILASERLVRR